MQEREKIAMLIFHLYTPQSKQFAVSKQIIKTYFSYVHWTKTYLISSFKGAVVHVPNTVAENVTTSKTATNEDAYVSAWDAVTVVTKLHRTIKWTMSQ